MIKKYKKIKENEGQKYRFFAPAIAIKGTSQKGYIMVFLFSQDILSLDMAGETH